MIRLGILGSEGRMGEALKGLLLHDSRFQWVRSKERGTSFEGFLKGVDVLIDFSAPQATYELLQGVRGQKVSLVIGTTGLSAEIFELMKEKSKEIPIFYSPNMSLAMAWMNLWVEKTARFFKESDVDITESHHRYKKDAPSGTAKWLGVAIEEGRGCRQTIIKNYEEYPRTPQSIGFSVRRGGNQPGYHAVHFSMDDEELVVNHTAYSRRPFAQGALEAASWIQGKKLGLYGMRDMLNLENTE